MSSEQEKSSENRFTPTTKEQFFLWLDKELETERITSFWDTTPIEHDPHKANKNVINALGTYKKLEADSLDALIIAGSMGNGKSTFLIKLIEWLREEKKTVHVYTHTFDKERSGEKGSIMIQAGEEGMQIEVDADLYFRVSDLILESEKWNEGDTVVIDEFMFAQENNEDPPKTNSVEINRLLYTTYQRGVKLVVSGLTTDFIGNVWNNMRQLMMTVKKIYYIVGICDTKNCNNPSECSTRRTIIENSDGDTTTRHSDSSEKVLRAGTVLKNGKKEPDDYSRSCRTCHKVLTPEEAIKHDQEFERVLKINTVYK